MAQEKIKINGNEIWQPDSGISHSFETTYTEDSTRAQTGAGYFTPIFTVEQIGYTATHIPVKEAQKILRYIIKGRPFTLRYYSLYYGGWRDGKFYVGKGNCNIGSLEDGEEFLDSLSFNMTGVDPL